MFKTTTQHPTAQPNNQLVEGMENPSKPRDWCSRSKDTPEYTSDHSTGLCMDATGKGSRRDYCRMVTKGADTFLACDLGSKGGYSYWFRSITQSDGLPVLEVPYAKSTNGRRVDSYCGVVPPTSSSPARAVCLDVKGAGFGSTPRDDPDPPEAARLRLITYESLISWFPLVYPASAKSVGAFPGVRTDIEIRATPPAILPESYPDRRGVRIWRGAPKLLPVGGRLPINESSCVSLMFKPDSRDNNSSEQVLLYAADGPYLNEFSIAYNPALESVTLRTYDGKAMILKISANGIKKDTWNHVLFQYNNGFWESWVATKRHTRKASPRHSFTRRGQQFIGFSPEGHTASHFSGSIADIRFYESSRSPLVIQSIYDDFMVLQGRTADRLH
jgi:hypothetical protein